MVQERREWFIHRDCTDVGPLTPKELRALAATGIIAGDTPVRREGMKHWLRANQFNGLFGAFTALQPAATTAPPPASAPPVATAPTTPLLPTTRRGRAPDLSALARSRPWLALMVAILGLNLLLLGLVAVLLLRTGPENPQPATTPLATPPALPPASPRDPAITGASEPVAIAATPPQTTLPEPEPTQEPPPDAAVAVAPPGPVAEPVTVPPLAEAPTPDEPVAQPLPEEEPPAPPVAEPPPVGEPPLVLEPPPIREPVPPEPVPTPPVVAEPATLVEAAPPLTWERCGQTEQRSTDRFLQHDSWVYRCFGVMRLERYRGPGMVARLAAVATDPAWEVRCLALRCAVRTQAPLPGDCLATETEPHVLRTALRLEMPVAERQIEAALRELRASRNVEDHLLAIEIQACVLDPRHRREASSAFIRLLNRLKDDLAMILEPRLAGLTGVDRAPDPSGMLNDPRIPYQDGLAKRWRDWVTERADGELFIDQRQRRAPAVLPAIALLDADEVGTIYDYLGELSRKQLEVAILVDATGSMAPVIRDCLQQVNRLIVVSNHLAESMRVGFVAFRDGHGALAEEQALTDRIDDVRQFLARVRAGGGSGFGGVINGLERLKKWSWTRDAVREVVVIGDAPVPTLQLQMTMDLLQTMSGLGFVTHLVATGGTLPWRSIEGAANGRSLQAPPDVDLAQLILELSLDPAVVPSFADFYRVFVELCL